MLFRDKPKGPVTAASLAAQLQQAEQDLATLESQEPALSLAVAEQVGGAEANLTALQERIGEKRANIATLRAAHRAAQQREAAADRDRRARLVAETQAAVAAELDASVEDGKTFERHLRAAAKAHRSMHERRQRAADLAVKIGGLVPGARLYGTALVRAVEGEIYRLSDSGTMAHEYSLPGGRPIGWETIHNPAAIPSLVSQLELANATAVDGMRGGVERAIEDLADAEPVRVFDRGLHPLAT